MITKHELSVLEHTSRTGRYITDEESVRQMAARGLLRDHGGTGFWTPGTRGYTLSRSGSELLNEHYRNLCRFPQPKPKRPPSPAFEAWRQYCDACARISFREFLTGVWPEYRRKGWA